MPYYRYRRRHSRRINDEARRWRNAVLARDNYTCDISKVKLPPQKLQAHHLEAWAWNKLQRCNIDNGITLSTREHRLFHEWMGGIEVRCTRQDYYRYKAIRVQESLLLGV